MYYKMRMNLTRLSSISLELRRFASGRFADSPRPHLIAIRRLQVFFPKPGTTVQDLRLDISCSHVTGSSLIITAARILSLPNELASQTCRFLEEDDLRRLCRVSKWCLKQGRRILYHEVVLWSEQIPSFLRTIIRHPRLAGLVRIVRLSSFEGWNPRKRDMEFFQKQLVGTGTHAGVIWTNIVWNQPKLCGVFVENLLLRLENLEQMDLSFDLNPQFILLSTNEVGLKLALPASLKSMHLLGEDGTKNLGGAVLPNILAASRVETLTAEFLDVVDGIRFDSSRYDHLLHLHLIACKFQKRDLQGFLRKCSSLQSFRDLGDLDLDDVEDEDFLDRFEIFEMFQITTRDIVEALASSTSTLRHLHIQTTGKFGPIDKLRSFTSLERLRIVHHELAPSSGERFVDDDDDAWGAYDSEDDDDSMPGHDNGEDDDDDDVVRLEFDSFLEKLPPSLRLLRIDRANDALLKEPSTISSMIHTLLPNLEKIELQSQNELLLQAAVRAVQGSGVVVELV